MKTLKLVLAVALVTAFTYSTTSSAVERDSVYAWGHWNKLTAPAAGPTALGPHELGLQHFNSDASRPKVEQPVITPPVHTPVVIQHHHNQHHHSAPVQVK